MVFAIHQHESGSMCIHVSPLPTSLPTLSLWVIPEHWLWVLFFMHPTCTGHLFYTVFLFYVLDFGPKSCGILLPQLGIEPAPLGLEGEVFFLYSKYYLFIFIVVVFAIHWRESAMDLHVFPIPIPPPTSLPTPSLWVFPVHQPWAPVSCIQPTLAICFTLDSILVSMLFSQNIPPSPSPTESKRLFCTSVSLFLFCI